MPITVERDDARRRIVARVSGVLGMSDLLTFVSAHRTGVPRADALLVDLRQATGMPTGDDLEAFAEMLATLSRAAPHGRAALVATNDVVFGPSRQLEYMCEAKQVFTLRAYRAVDEAEAWLDGCGE